MQNWLNELMYVGSYACFSVLRGAENVLEYCLGGIPIMRLNAVEK